MPASGAGDHDALINTVGLLAIVRWSVGGSRAADFLYQSAGFLKRGGRIFSAAAVRSHWIGKDEAEFQVRLEIRAEQTESRSTAQRKTGQLTLVVDNLSPGLSRSFANMRNIGNGMWNFVFL